jgi:hypothetical protein
MTATRKVPDALRAETENDPERGAKTVLFRRIAGAARITIFEGGHEQVTPAAFAWLSAQVKGKPADFAVPVRPRGPVSGAATEVAK